MNVQELERALGKNAELVTVEATASKFIIKMKRKEAKDVWQEIADTIKGLGGKWVYGKDSHGEIPFVAENKNLPTKAQIQITIAQLERIEHDASEALKRLRLLTEEMK